MKTKAQKKQDRKDYLIAAGIGLGLGTAYVLIQRARTANPDFTDYRWTPDGDLLIVINGHLHRFLGKPSE